MQQTRVIQNRNRLIEMPVFHFKLRKLEQARRDRWRFDAGESQISKQLAGTLSPPGANFQPGEIPPRECSPWLFRSAHPFLEFAARGFMLRTVQLI